MAPMMRADSRRDDVPLGWYGSFTRRHLRLVAMSVLAGLLVGAAVALHHGRVYTATIEVIASKAPLGSSPEASELSGNHPLPPTVDTEAQLLESAAVLKPVAKSLGGGRKAEGIRNAMEVVVPQGSRALVSRTQRERGEPWRPRDRATIRRTTHPAQPCAAQARTPAAGELARPPPPQWGPGRRRRAPRVARTAGGSSRGKGSGGAAHGAGPARTARLGAVGAGLSAERDDRPRDRRTLGTSRWGRSGAARTGATRAQQVACEVPIPSARMDVGRLR